MKKKNIKKYKNISISYFSSYKFIPMFNLFFVTTKHILSFNLFMSLYYQSICALKKKYKPIHNCTGVD